MQVSATAPNVGTGASLSNRTTAPAGPANARLGVYACDPDQSRGRRFEEPPGRLRSAFQRDRDRIVHSTAFRRLEYKTQVFVNHEGDHFRTRLTHTLEVAQITRTLARALRLDEDLAEAVALAHDLGHSPFGHAGETALDLALRDHGGFDHNVQTLRVITRLEGRYAAFDGLNLTWETLEGVVKHNGPLAEPHPFVTAYDRDHPLELGSHPSAEAQIASLADDIAYSNHDLDDGLRAGLFTLGQVSELPLVGAAVREVVTAHPNLETPRLIHEALRRMIDAMVSDLVQETDVRLKAVRPASSDGVRRHGRAVAAFSPQMRTALEALRSFLYAHMYGHYRVKRMARKAQRVVQALFESLLEAPECLPPEWRARAGAAAAPETALAIGDYIAGMTDRYALDEYDRLINLTSRRP